MYITRLYITHTPCILHTRACILHVLHVIRVVLRTHAPVYYAHTRLYLADDAEARAAREDDGERQVTVPAAITAQSGLVTAQSRRNQA